MLPRLAGLRHGYQHIIEVCRRRASDCYGYLSPQIRPAPLAADGGWQRGAGWNRIDSLKSLLACWRRVTRGRLVRPDPRRFGGENDWQTCVGLMIAEALRNSVSSGRGS